MIEKLSGNINYWGANRGSVFNGELTGTLDGNKKGGCRKNRIISYESLNRCYVKYFVDI